MKFFRQIIDNVKQKARTEATRTKHTLLENYPDEPLGVTITSKDQDIINQVFDTAFKTYLKEEVGEKIDQLQEMINSPAWTFYMKLLAMHEYPENKYSNFLEQAAFEGQRAKTIHETIKIPEMAIKYFNKELLG